MNKLQRTITIVLTSFGAWAILFETTNLRESEPLAAVAIWGLSFLSGFLTGEGVDK